MLLHKAVRESQDGDLIELTATDKSTERDVEKFCNFLGHKLLEKIDAMVLKFVFLLIRDENHELFMLDVGPHSRT